MYNQIYNAIVSFIWGIADDCLRDVYVRGKYRDVILPMTVIRRLDAMLEDSKEAVLDMKKKDLQQLAGISAASITKLGKNENVNTEIIEKICVALQCDVSDIMEMADED